MWPDVAKCLETFLSTFLLSLHSSYDNQTGSSQSSNHGSSAISSGSASSGASENLASGNNYNWTPSPSPVATSVDTSSSEGNLVSLQSGAYAASFSPGSSKYTMAPSPVTDFGSGGFTLPPFDFGESSSSQASVSSEASSSGMTVDPSIDFSPLLKALQQLAIQMQAAQAKTTTESAFTEMEQDTTTSGAMTSGSDQTSAVGGGDGGPGYGSSSSQILGSLISDGLSGNANRVDSGGSTDHGSSENHDASSGQDPAGGGQVAAVSVGNYGGAAYGYGSSSYGTGSVGAEAASSPTLNKKYTPGMPASSHQTAAPAASKKTFAFPLSSGATRCRIPGNVQGAPVLVSKMTGVWYEAMYRLPALKSVFNVFYVYTPLGFAILRETGTWGLVTTYSIFQYAGEPPNQKCMGIFQQANITTDGRKIAAPVPPKKSQESSTYTVLATDYDTMEFSYRCGKPNLETGFCDEPFFRLNTRENPKTLNQTVWNYIETTVNTALKPFCLSIRDLSLTNWVLLPACFPNPSIDFTRYIQKMIPLLSFGARSDKPV